MDRRCPCSLLGRQVHRRNVPRDLHSVASGPLDPCRREGAGGGHGPEVGRAGRAGRCGMGHGQIVSSTFDCHLFRGGSRVPGTPPGCMRSPATHEGLRTSWAGRRACVNAVVTELRGDSEGSTYVMTALQPGHLGRHPGGSWVELTDIRRSWACRLLRRSRLGERRSAPCRRTQARSPRSNPLDFLADTHSRNGA